MTARLAVLLAFLGISMSLAGAGMACERDGMRFPLKVEDQKAYPTYIGGQPFFMHGDTAWSLLADLTEEEAFVYLQDRRARGFNTILVSLIEHRFSRNAPANAYGERPFATGADFAKPNEAYFAHADKVLGKACELGFLVMLTPSYLGFAGGNEGWYAEMAAAGTGNLEAYGRFIGERYRHLDNIMWVHGGDYDPADRDLVRAVARGIVATDPDALGTVHTAPETAPLDFWSRESWLQVNNVYTYGPVHPAAIREHRSRGGMPFFLMESAYEFERGADEHRIRIQAYHAILAGAFGHLFGNNPIWHFGGPGLQPPPMDWKEALDSPGARSMQVLVEFVLSRKWWLLEPDAENGLLVEGIGAGMQQAVAATARDGSFGLVYMPGSTGVGVDLARLATSPVNARWIDPTTGEATRVDGSPFAPDRTRFKPPRHNERGYTDWILELVPQQPTERIQ